MGWGGLLLSLLERVSFHWRASRQHFSWLVWKGNVDSLVLFDQGHMWLLYYSSMGKKITTTAWAFKFRNKWINSLTQNSALREARPNVLNTTQRRHLKLLKLWLQAAPCPVTPLWTLLTPHQLLKDSVNSSMVWVLIRTQSKVDHVYRYFTESCWRYQPAILIISICLYTILLWLDDNKHSHLKKE